MTHRVLSVPIFTGLTRPVSGSQARLLGLNDQLRRLCYDNFVLEDAQCEEQQDQDHGVVYHYREFKPFGRTLSILRDLNPSYILTLVKVLRRERICLVQLSHPCGFIAAKFAATLSRRGTPLVYDAHNVGIEVLRESLEGADQAAAFLQPLVTALVDFLERLVCKKLANKVFAVSERDRLALQARHQLAPGKIVVIPSGCIIRHGPTEAEKAFARQKLGIDANKTVAIFHGYFQYPPNREAFDWIVEEIAPRIGQYDTDLLFLIGGTGAPRFRRDNVVSLGFIPNLDSFLAVADIAIVPISRGSGTRLKVLEYMSMGLPIVAMEKAIEGIDLVDGQSIFISGNELDEFVRTLKRVLASRDAWGPVGRHARQVAVQSYDWNVIGKKLDEVYQSILRGVGCN